MTPKKNKNPLLVIILLVVVASAVGGYFYFNQPDKMEEKKAVVVENITPSPTLTPKPSIDKTTVRIQVINGTGTPGQAGEVVDALETAGYSADKIKTGNADDFDNATSTITARANFGDIAKDIEGVLKTDFEDIKIESNSLESDSEFDIVIVTGGKIFETPTPTVAPTDTPTPTVETTVTPSPTSTPTLTPTPTP